MSKANTRKKRERRTLITAVALGTLIMAGSTFAWFTSSDEVTNKLSAEQTYNVSIVEDFKTPSSWAPGETVDKKVGIVNTGNINAFAKMSLSNQITIIKNGTPEAYNAANVAKYTKVNDKRKSLQGGGYLAWTNAAVTPGDVGTAFTPTDTGYYVFRRYFDMSDPSKTEYAGYFFDGTDYYALGSIAETTSGFDCKLQTIGDAVVKTPAITYDSTGKKFIAKFDNDTTDPKDDLIINILLDTAELANWTVVENDELYYNKTLKAAATSGNIIKALELDDSVDNAAYVKFEYGLTVHADSVQVVPGETTDATEVAAAVNAAGWTKKVTGGVVAGTAAAPEVTNIAWN